MFFHNSSQPGIAGVTFIRPTITKKGQANKSLYLQNLTMVCCHGAARFKICLWMQSCIYQ